VDSAAFFGPESVLRIGFMENVDSLNPFIGFTDVSRLFYSLIYDSLTTVDEDLNPAPDLALEAYPVAVGGGPFGSVWQYDLTTHAVWTDGVPLTADDVAYTINLNAGNYSTLWAYQPYTFFIEYAEKVDDYTVRVWFTDSCAYGDHLSIPILPKHKMESMSAGEIAFSWTGIHSGEDPPIVGSGAFMATSTAYEDWLDGDMLTLVRNPSSHWGSEYGKSVHFDKLEFLFFMDATAMSIALKTGQIDAASFPPLAYRALENEVEAGELDEVTLFTSPKVSQFWTHIGFCMAATDDPGYNNAKLDIDVRRAMALSVNKTYIAEQFYIGLAEEGSTIVPPANAFWHYEVNESEEFMYDLVTGAQVLEDAGYIDTDSDGIRECTAGSWTVQEGYEVAGTPLSFQLIVRHEYPEEKDIAMYLQSEWGEIGVAVDIIVVDKDIAMTIVYSYNYDMYLGSWSGDVDPNRQLFSLSPIAIAGWNDNCWVNASYAANYDASLIALDSETRRDYVWNCQRIHYLDVPNIVLAYTNQTWAWRTDRFSGWGDWDAHPGRSIDNFWGGNQLYFDLYYQVVIGSVPTALFTVSPGHGDIETQFVLDASASTDSEDSVSDLVVRWDFEGDGDFDTGWTTSKIVTHEYSEKGDYVVRLQVRDTSGNVNASTEEVKVSAGLGMTVALVGVGGVAAGTIVAAIAMYYVFRRRSGVPPPPS
jgi:peptide/nickel transport system substrate-binding protein